jgi:hypothetical protein
MKVRTSAGRMVLVVLAVLLGVSSGLGALLSAAALASRPPLLLLAGLAGFCAVYLLGYQLRTSHSLWSQKPVPTWWGSHRSELQRPEPYAGADFQNRATPAQGGFGEEDALP